MNFFLLTTIIIYRKARKSHHATEQKEYLKKEAERKNTERSQESEDERKMRRLVDATRHHDFRSEETTDEYQSRILDQNERQKHLLSQETPVERKTRQKADSTRKIVKRAAKADAFENSFQPNKDWNAKMDADMERHTKSRAAETLEMKTHRQDKDNAYQEKKRASLSLNEQNVIKQEKAKQNRQWRIEKKEEEVKIQLEERKQKNIEPLRQHGSYARFLLFGQARKVFYGQYIGFEREVEDWKLLESKISHESMMASEVYALSKKVAFTLQSLGLAKHDVVHLIVGNHVHTLAVILGVWIIGGVCSLTDVSTDAKTIEHQVSLHKYIQIGLDYNMQLRCSLI